ncbi:MAG: hypothetical protein Q8Q62_20100, partial [Mesorhizobium sp.]|nr:hypothetical protein [Mesorhizobium sp.]
AQTASRATALDAMTSLSGQMFTICSYRFRTLTKESSGVMGNLFLLPDRFQGCLTQHGRQVTQRVQSARKKTYMAG